jgi:hypothetical protein
VAGGFNTAMVLASKFTPRALTTYITNAVMRPTATNNK